MTKKKLAAFRPQRNNVNKHKPNAMALLDKSIRGDGWMGAITTAADGEVFAGSARLETAAEVMGESDPIIVETDGTRPVIIKRTDIPTADDPRAKRLGVADNSIAAASWNPDGDLLAMLAADDEAIAAMVRNDDTAARAVMEAANKAGDGDAEPQIDRAEELREKWQTERGQLWAIGEHRLLCGDSTAREDVERVMGGEKADMIQTDPPYGVDYSGQSDSMFYGKNKTGISREKIASDDTPEKAAELTKASLSFERSPVLFLWCAPQYSDLAKEAATQNGYAIFSVIVWNKNNANFGAMGARYKPKYEMALACKRDTIPWYGPDNETTVWDIDRASKNEFHPTQKPVTLFERAIKNHTQVDAIIYEPFAGSGTALVACQNLNRKCRAIEISPAYCAVILERMAQAFPGIEIKQI